MSFALDSFEVVRMNVSLDSFRGPVALHLFQRAPVEIEQHLIRLNELPLGVQNDHMLRKEIDQLPQFLIGVPKRRGRRVALVLKAF